MMTGSAIMLRLRRGPSRRAIFLFLSTLCLLGSMSLLEATEVESEAAADSNDTVKEEPIEFPEKHWGQYYDPSNVFCGEYDCYKILGFDFESWGRSPPTKKEITQSYRGMSRMWHPDKNRDKGASERFQKISTAYKILTDNKKRREFDHMRGRPDEYFYKYGTHVWVHAPKSDTVLVVTLLLLLGCAFTWYAQKNRWQQIADRVVKDAVEGLKSSDGASRESLDVRLKAEEKLRLRKEAEGGDASGGASKEKKSRIRLTKKENREKENEELRPIIVELVNEIQDFGFGAGFHQPTWRDILVVKMLKWPYPVVMGLTWEAKYYARRILKAELNANEREVLTRRAVGWVAWKAAEEKDRESMVTQELWVTANLEEWLEFQKMGQLSMGQQKKYNRWMKKDKQNEAKKGN